MSDVHAESVWCRSVGNDDGLTWGRMTRDLGEASWIVDVCVLTFFHVCANAIVRTFAPRKPLDTRWLLFHALGNVYCVARAIVGMGEDHRSPLRIVLWIHAYHILFYVLTPHDRLHHYVFIPLLAIPGAVWDWGYPSSLAVIFINGLPGALLYIVVCITRFQKRRNGYEPLITCIVNAVVRCPGILVANYHLWHNVPENVPYCFVAIQLILSPTNAIYYTILATRRWKRVRDTSVTSMS